jgi:PAS domain S-box-containing protein
LEIQSQAFDTESGSKPKIYLTTIGLGVLAFAGNYLSLPFFYGVDFIFGSVAVMMAVTLLGTAPSMVVAAIGGVYTITLWGHPYAVIIFVAEAFVVSYLYKRGQRNLVMADLFYWLVIGIPLVFIFYRGAIQMPTESASLIAFKQSLNGLLNTLTASLLIIGTRVVRDENPRYYANPTELSTFLFHAILFPMLIAGGVPIVFQGYEFRAQQESYLEERMRNVNESLSHFLTDAHIDDVELLRDTLERYEGDYSISVARLGDDDQVVISAGEMIDTQRFESKSETSPAGFEKWLPIRDMSVMNKWKASRYRLVSEASNTEFPLRIVIESEAAPIVEKVERKSLTLFILLSVFVVLGIFGAHRISSWLSQLLSRLSRVAAETINGVVITDRNGNVEWVNEGFTRITGYGLEDVKGGKPGAVLQGPDTDKNTIASISASLKNLQGFDAEILNYTRSGTPYWLQISCNPFLDDKGVMQGFIAIETDITQRKNAELDVKRAMNLAEQGSRAKSEFLANMSHEIRTPLNGMIGMAELMLGTKLDELQSNYLNTMQSSANTLLAMVNEILDISKIEAGMVELEGYDFSTKDFLDEFISTFEVQALQKRIKLNYILEPEVPALLNGDIVRLRQILTNLVSNAIKFTEVGEVEVAVSNITNGRESYSCDAGNEGPGETAVLIKFSVSDTGIGIPEEKVDKIFEQFAQADTSTTRKYGGTGLGLAISKQLVELMGGQIDVDSQEERGSTFWFTVRLNRQQSLQSTPHPLLATPESQTADSSKADRNSQESPLFNARILVVEDNPVNQKVALGLLERLGCQVEIAENGEEAIQFLSTSTFDLVFMDCQMPVMDGYEATRLIRNKRTNVMDSNTLIIAMTANAMDEDRKKCFEIGMNDYLAKPITLDVLKECMEKWLSSNVPLQ